jgi:hypothetical protein
MKKESGTHFDPELLSSFWDVLPEVLAVEHEFGSKELHPEVAVVRRPKQIAMGGTR